jgi:S1-C subfamily serine protease
VSVSGARSALGAVVAAVDGGGPAAKAGIPPGDIIASIEGRQTSGRVSRDHTAGGGGTTNVDVRLGTHPDGG